MSGIGAGVGFFLGVMAIGLVTAVTFLLAVGVSLRLRARAGEAGDPPVEIELLSDDELRTEVKRAAAELDLWMRAAAVREVPVKLSVVEFDTDGLGWQKGYRVRIDG